MTGTAQEQSGPRASVSEIEEEINVINDKESKRFELLIMNSLEYLSFYLHNLKCLCPKY